MSYCRRFWDDDIYMFEHVDGHIECCGCPFDDPWIVELHSVEDAIAHVARHRAVGHEVRAGLEDDIRAENPWNGT